MSLFFISHSSRDNALAEQVRQQLADRGHRSVFLDFHPEDGIPAGRDWEQELYRSIRGCRAVIVICSKHSMSSKWCFMEITHARSLGKTLFPIRIDDCELDGVLADRQVIDMTTVDAPLAWKRLENGILAAGLDPADAFDWDAARPPYPGLLAFQEEDAAVFFGRDDEISEGLDMLNRAYRLGDRRLSMVLGASGTGKSSLVRAGLLPRLRRDTERWLVLEPMRPRENPLRELAFVFSRAFERLGQPVNHVSIEERLAQGVGTATDTTVLDGWTDRSEFIDQITRLEAELPESGADQLRRYLTLAKQAAAEPNLQTRHGDRSVLTDDNPNPVIGLAEELRRVSDHSEAKVLLIVDQFEECLGQPTDDPAHQFLRLIRDAIERKNGTLFVLGTMRSDFLGAFQKERQLLDLHYHSLSLGPLSTGDIAEVIEKPSRVASIDLEPGLVQELISDAETEDALPLLAFTLRELNERYGQDKLLELDEYRNQLGGLKQAVAKSADEVLQSVSLGPEHLECLRKAFLALVKITEDGGYARRPALWVELPEQVHNALKKFVDSRLLIADGDDQQRTLEVAHETLFRSWGRLRSWLDEAAEELNLREELRRASRQWEREGRNTDSPWGGSRLIRARELVDRGELQLEARDVEFVEACEQNRDATRLAEEARRQRNFRRLIAGAAACLILAVIAGVLAVWAFEERSAAQVAKTDADEKRAAAIVAEAKAVDEKNAAERARAEAEFMHFANSIAVISTFATAERWDQTMSAQYELGHGYLFQHFKKMDPRVRGQVEKGLSEISKILEQEKNNQKFEMPYDERGGLVIGLAHSCRPEFEKYGGSKYFPVYQSHLYGETKRVAQGLLAVSDLKAARPLIQRFWELYYGTLALVESGLVAQRMIDVGSELLPLIFDPQTGGVEAVVTTVAANTDLSELKLQLNNLIDQLDDELESLPDGNQNAGSR